ncbi:MAG: S8 family serine peptidase [Puniceicoccaceae bacterium]
MVCGSLIAEVDRDASGKPVKGKAFEAKTILVKVKSNKGQQKKLERLLEDNGLKQKKALKAISGWQVLELKEKDPGKSREARMKGLQKRVESLKKSGQFQHVEIDSPIRIQQVPPTDSYFASGELWGLENTGQSGGAAGVDVNAVSGWAINTGSSSTVVAVIDTGIRYTHQDLVGNMWSNSGEVAANGIDDDSNGYIDDIYGINAITGTGNPLDDHGHGSHVAGTIGATANDSGGHVGVAHDVQLMALKALDSAGYGTTSGAVLCIDYAISKGASVINASWGDTTFSQALKDSISAANSAGILFVAAAGNSGMSNDFIPFYPASYDVANVVSVAAVDRTGARASFSNYGSVSVDLGAPGVDILSTTSNTNSSYGYKDGTSMASPHVAGVAALLISEHPSAGIHELTTRLIQTTTPLAGLSGYTLSGGIVNAAAALSLAADGDMELLARAERGALIDGKLNTITIMVTDLSPVTGATVTAYLDGEVTPTSFLDDGVAPDETANDAIYTASMLAPTGVSSVNLHITANATGKTTAMETVAFQVINPPSMDDFENAFLLTSPIGSDNTFATIQPGEMINPAGAGTHSVWFEWIPDYTGHGTITTEGSYFDTTLAVYSGDTLETLTLLDSNDDYGTKLFSVIELPVTSGQSYKIQVNGYSYEAGFYILDFGSFQYGPLNDDFADRMLLEPGTNQVMMSTVDGSLESGEPQPIFTWFESTVWFDWIAPANGLATITTAGSNFDTALCVYTGSAVNALSHVASNDDDGIEITSAVSFTATEGQSYKIQVYGSWADSTGEGDLVLNYTPSPAAPSPIPNDFFANRIVLTPGTTETTGSNYGATFETDEPTNPSTAGTRSVWWEYIAATTGTVTIDTNGSNFDTTLAVYTGDVLASLTLIADDDDTSGTQSEVTFTAVQGESYMIQVNGADSGSSTESGNIKLNYTPPGYPIPANDDFENRIYLEYGSSQVTGTNLGATLEGGEPINPTGAGERSVWWEWVAAGSTPVTIDTAGSSYDTTLAIYSGTSLSDLTLEGDNNDFGGLQSSVTFTPTISERYFIQVNGNGTAAGDITLNYPNPGIPKPENDDFADRIVLPPGSIQVTGSNESATTEPSEPANPLTASGLSIWYEWISPFTGSATIDTIGSSFDTTLLIYTGTDLATLTLVDSSDDYFSYFSSITFDAVSGTSYMIKVDGDPEILDEGLVVLNYPMPWPVYVSPGRIRLSGTPGSTEASSISILNADSIAVDYTISTGDSWLGTSPDAGTIPAGSTAIINLTAGPLPAFSLAVDSEITIGLNHPSVSTIQIPLEVINDSIVVEIPDTNLRRVVEEHLGRLPDEPIADIEMQSLFQLDGTGRSIGNLTGLRHAVNLWYLYLGENEISDLTQLGSLNSLYFLFLNDNNIHDISVLSSLTTLLSVDLRLNYLDTNTGSDDLAVITALSTFADVDYLPQKSSMISFTDWADSHSIPMGSRNWTDTHGPLGLSNLMAYSMGLDPFTATASQLPVSYRDPDTNQFIFSYYRDLRALGITTSILTSHDMGAWIESVPVRFNVIWEDGNGHQLVEAVFEDNSTKMFFSLDVEAY